MRGFKRDRVHVASSAEDLAAALAAAGQRLVVVEFVTSWSQPCIAMAPYLGSLSQQSEFRAVEFVRVDLEACPGVGLRHNVVSAPTYSFFRESRLLESFSGAQPSVLLQRITALRGVQKKEAPWRLLGLGLLLALGVGAALMSSGSGDSAAAPPSLPPPPPASSKREEIAPTTTPLPPDGLDEAEDEEGGYEDEEDE
jgi:thiol-disulfide isomerase/thioredoxin